MELTEAQVAERGLGLCGPAPSKPLWQAPAKGPKAKRPDGRTPFPPQPESLPDERRASAKESCSHPVAQSRVLFSARDFVTNHRFEIAHCFACGLAVTSPQLNPDKIAAYYPAGYYGDPRNRRFPRLVETLQKALYARRVRMVESGCNGRRGRVLDVGCGRGELLVAFRRRGWEAQGTELSDQAARHARQVANVPVATGCLEEIGFPSEYFDAITMWHVLEHVHDPQAVFQEVSRILKPGGVFLVGVPDFGSFEARTFRDKWFHLDVPRHLTHFTKRTLTEALTRNGFEARRWSGFAPEYDSFSFVQSVLNRIGMRHNLLYNVLRGKQAKVIDGDWVPRWQTAASILLGAVLGVTSLPLTALAGWLGQAGTMTVMAVKKRND